MDTQLTSAAEPLRQALVRARKELLDLSARNRLIHTPRDRVRSSRLDIVGERADEVFRILVREGRSMTFGAVKDDADARSQPNDPEERYTDNVLETNLGAELLSKRLLSRSVGRTKGKGRESRGVGDRRGGSDFIEPGIVQSE